MRFTRLAPTVLLAATLPVAALAQTPDSLQPLPTFIPALTDEDRATAFPDVGDHLPGHRSGIHHFVLLDRLEWQRPGSTSVINVESKGWIGGDINRFWFRLEGEGWTDRLDSGLAHALYGRAVSPWWDVLVGVRQDVRPGSPQTWAAVGIQGLAPYWFEVEATAYVNTSGDIHARIETEYDLLLTNRLILQPLIEAEIYGFSDPGRGIGRGIGRGELGLRLRYEVRRELAPYIGVIWHRAFGATDDFRTGEETEGARLTLGLRHWF